MKEAKAGHVVSPVGVLGLHGTAKGSESLWSFSDEENQVKLHEENLQPITY